MSDTLSERLLAVVEALPLKPGMRVLEIGCGPGAMARVMSQRVGNGFVLGIDRSEKAIRQAQKHQNENLEFRLAAIEHFECEPGEPLFDLAVAIRVGALDGRHPRLEEQALKQIVKALKPNGKLYIDGGKEKRLR